MKMKNVCLLLTSGIVCACIIYYSWSLYSEVKVLKKTLSDLENTNQSKLQMSIESVSNYDEQNNEDEVEYYSSGQALNDEGTALMHLSESEQRAVIEKLNVVTANRLEDNESESDEELCVNSTVADEESEEENCVEEESEEE